MKKTELYKRIKDELLKDENINKKLVDSAQNYYENLSKYLYSPYKKLGGNGSAERVMRQVDQLPIHASADDCIK